MPPATETNRGGGAPQILGPDGLPFRDGRGRTEDQRGAMVKSIFAMANSYVQSLASIRLPSITLAQDPLANHAWVFASAMLRANVQGQAPLTIVRETQPAMERRRIKAKAQGIEFQPPRAGHERRAIQRYHRLRTIDRAFTRAYEADDNHPVAQVLERPNPYQDGAQLMAYSILWYVIRGELFWVKTADDGGPVTPGEVPARIYPIGPDCFEPALEFATHGELIGWWYRPPKWMPGTRPGQRILLDLDEVVQFKTANPRDPLRGLSPITALAQQIETDIGSRQHTSALLRNGAVPKALITNEIDMTKGEESAFLERWKDKHEGVDNAGRTAMLTGGFKYQVLGLSPADMQFLERELRDRDEIFGVMGTPPSVMGINHDLNYATQTGQDKNFWDKSEIPMLCMFERAIDRGLLFHEVDNVSAIFDLRNVEALRAGLADKVAIAERLAGDRLHVAPRVAFDMVDLPVDEYDGEDIALVGALLVPVQSAIDAASNPPEPSPPPPPPPAADPTADPAAAAVRAPNVRAPRSSAQQRRKRWRQFVKLEIVLENSGRRAYRSWISRARAAALQRFDDNAAKRKSLFVVRDSIDLSQVVPDLAELQKWLKEGVRPTYASTLDEVFSFTSEEIGVPTFSIDDGALMAALDLRERSMVNGAPRTMFQNLRASLLEGVKNGDSVSSLRARIGEVFKISSSSSRTLTWARTEVGGLMSEVRTNMFDLQGVEDAWWTDAGDEHVRADHQIFAQSGVQKRGFDFLTLIDRSDGTLEYPGDARAPVDEIVNCRCMESPG